MKYAIVMSCLAHVLAIGLQPVLAVPPLLTGVIEDGGSQVIEMPATPGTWIRNVDWMAPEGVWVNKGDVVVRINPGQLIEQEESRRTSLEEQTMNMAAQDAQNLIAVIDAETQLEQAKSTRQLAWLDAQIPSTAITQLDYEKSQLALQNAENALRLAEEALEHALQKREEHEPVAKQAIEHAQTTWQQSRDALDQIDILAERDGIMLYGENPRTGAKIFPGEALPTGSLIATIAARGQLQFVFWVHDADVRKVDTSDVLTVIPDALPFQEIEAKVIWISNYAVERESWSEGGYFKLIAEPMELIPGEWLPGMAIFAERKS